MSARQSPGIPQCPDCNGTGWKYVRIEKGEDPRVTRCGCRDRLTTASMERMAALPTGDSGEVRSFVETLRREARGPKKAKSAKELGPTVFGRENMTDYRRRLRAIAHEATELGHPIASGNFGYFYATRPEELDGTIDRLQSMATQGMMRVAKLKRLREILQAERNGGQLYERTAPDAEPESVAGG